MTMNDPDTGSFKDDIDKWQKVWDKVSHKFENIPPVFSNAHTNITNFSNVSSDNGEEDDSPSFKNDIDKLQKVWDKSSGNFGSAPQSNRPEVLSEMHWQEIYNRAQNIGNVFKENDSYALRPNPIETASKGTDQNLRVTPNFSDGNELRELSRIKIEVEALERKIHSAEVNNESNSSFKKALDGLNRRIELLSNSLTPNQEEDVT